MKKWLTVGAALLCWTAVPTFYARKLSPAVLTAGPDTPHIALTFDDGPHPVYTPVLLDLLAQHNVKATFFVLGKKAKQFPHLIRRMIQEGHEVGVHHHTHRSNWLLSPRALKQELNASCEAVSSITGQPVHFYRPPWGHINPFTLPVADSLQVVLWTSIPGDWKKSMTTDVLYEKLTAARKNGAIITLHDSGDTPGAYQKAPGVMIQALQLFLTDPASAHYRFVTVQAMNQQNEEALTQGG